MSLQLLPIKSEEIPVSKIFELNGETFEFIFRYNSKFDFITLEIRQEGTFLFSSKLCYGNNMIQGFGRIPFAIVPFIEDDLYIDNYSGVSVNLETLGKTVNLYFEDGV